MTKELKIWQFTCDGANCSHTEMVFSMWHKLPSGWGTREVGGCGMTNYTKTEELCPECYEKHLENKSGQR